MKRMAWVKVTLCFFSMIFLFVQPVYATRDYDPPEIVTIDTLKELYEAVDFDHATHMEIYSCGSCHHHTTGDEATNTSCNTCHAGSESSDKVACIGCHTPEGFRPANSGKGVYHIDKPGLKGALHLQCTGCHKENGGPIECTDCHALTPAGKKRFRITE